MLSIKWLAHDGTQVVPRLGAVERVRKDLGWRPGPQPILRRSYLESNSASGRVTAERLRVALPCTR